MKRIIASILATAMLLAGVVGCGHSHNEIKEKTHDGKLQVVCSIYPVYDWLTTVGGDLIDVTYLLESGVDLHNYQPTVTDMVTIKEADLFVYVGGHSDTWVADVIEDSTSALILLGEVAESDLLASDHVHDETCTDPDCDDPDHNHDHDEECTDEDCDNPDHNHDHDEECTDEDCDNPDHDHDHDEECTDEDCDNPDHDHDHDEECTDEDCDNPDHNHDEEEHVHDDECTDEDCEEHNHDDSESDVHIHDETCNHDHDYGEYDEHIWMSLKHSATIVQSIVDALCIMDPTNADTFKTNGADYITEINALDSEYSAVISSAKINNIVVADRFPLHYLVNDYGINHLAAFNSCTAESEVSFSTLTNLVTEVKDKKLDYILVIDGSDYKVANTVASEAGDVEILMINSMQTITASDITSGVSYLNFMKENLEVLKTILN